MAKRDAARKRQELWEAVEEKQTAALVFQTRYRAFLAKKQYGDLSHMKRSQLERAVLFFQGRYRSHMAKQQLKGLLWARGDMTEEEAAVHFFQTRYRAHVAKQFAGDFRWMRDQAARERRRKQLEDEEEARQKANAAKTEEQMLEREYQFLHIEDQGPELDEEELARLVEKQRMKTRLEALKLQEEAKFAALDQEIEREMRRCEIIRRFTDMQWTEVMDLRRTESSKTAEIGRLENLLETSKNSKICRGCDVKLADLQTLLVALIRTTQAVGGVGSDALGDDELVLLVASSLTEAAHIDPQIDEMYSYLSEASADQALVKAVIPNPKTPESIFRAAEGQNKYRRWMQEDNELLRHQIEDLEGLVNSIGQRALSDQEPSFEEETLHVSPMSVAQPPGRQPPLPRQRRQQPPQLDRAVLETFQEMDTNRDGVISRQEWMEFHKKDTNAAGAARTPRR
eukprot:TRINITY_DN18065_c0_g2_i1.p1 TRINITY_DN18065_c0_g2~~TRINITY_DN18065_c0_g2_i1.p1  ORF type:complete len:455 (-),score=137.62 TRINITY_DN18065_c0_g2_i1:228-1592(-)